MAPIDALTSIHMYSQFMIFPGEEQALKGFVAMPGARKGGSLSGNFVDILWSLPRLVQYPTAAAKRKVYMSLSRHAKMRLT